NKPAVLNCGPELPLPDGFDGFLIQAQARAADDLDIRHLASTVDFNIEKHGALVLGSASFFRVLRFLLIEQEWNGRVKTDAVSRATRGGGVRGFAGIVPRAVMQRRLRL